MSSSRSANGASRPSSSWTPHEEKAIGALLEFARNRALYEALRRGIDPNVSDDIVQTIFRRLIEGKALRQLLVGGKHNAWAYLTRSVSRAFIDHFRGQTRNGKRAVLESECSSGNDDSFSLSSLSDERRYDNGNEYRRIVQVLKDFVANTGRKQYEAAFRVILGEATTMEVSVEYGVRVRTVNLWRAALKKLIRESRILRDTLHR